MNERSNKFLALALLILTLTGTALAEQGGGVIRREERPDQGREIERSAVNYAGPVGSGTTKLIGSVIDIRQVAVAGAKVQVRNLDTGNIEETGESDEQGAYEFELESSGTYVVEMIMVDGAVVALSNAGSLPRFGTLNTVVQLPGRWDAASRVMVPVQNMGSFLGMSSATSMTSTTIEIATEQNVKPQDPGIQASPTS